VDNKKEYDQAELEVCLRNLIVVGNILKIDKDESYRETLMEYIQALSELTDGEDPLISKINAINF
jgi:hypothetical protein